MSMLGRPNPRWTFHNDSPIDLDIELDHMEDYTARNYFRNISSHQGPIVRPLLKEVEMTW
jgi:hypothetical protein